MIKAGIVGGTGYTGAELLRLLAAHDGTEITTTNTRRPRYVEGRQQCRQKVDGLHGFCDPT